MGTPDGTQSRALLCVYDDATAGPLACAFAHAGLITTLAGDAARCLERIRTEDHDVVVVALRGAKSERGFLRELHALRATNHSALVVLSDDPLTPGDVAALGVHAQMPAGSEPALVAAQAGVLLDLLRPGNGGPDTRTDTGHTRQWGALALDTRTRQAWWDGAPVDLTRLQFSILEVLVEARGAVVTTGALCERIWHDEPVYDNERLFAHIRRIRSKIEAAPNRPAFLLTVRGVGFRLADESAVPTPTAARARGWRGPERRRGDRRRLPAADPA